jgi:subtilase family protein
MSSRFLAIGALGILTAITAVSAVGPSQPMLHRPNSAGTSTLHVAGSRSLQQRQSAAGSKFDASLAEIARHVSSVRPDHAVEDLHAVNPAARFMQPASTSVPLVLIDAITTGDPQKLKSALVGLGLQHASQYSNDVGGWLPVDQLDAATTLTELHAIRAAMPRTRSGAVTSQGDYAQNSNLLRSQNALTGAGITVGVLSDSYNCYPIYAANGVPAGGNAGYANNGFNTTAASDTTSGDLPASVNVLEDANCMNYGPPIQLPFGDEGRAIMQVIHDVAPGAGLAFYTAENSEADFASGIGKLALSVASGGAGANVIVDDVGYFDEPFFQDGLVAQAVNAVVAQGVAYFSSAGNNGTLAYDNNAPTFATPGTGLNLNEHLLNFNQQAGGAVTTMLPVSIPSLIPGEFIAIVAEWDQPYVTGAPNSGGAQNQIDLCVQGAAGDIIGNLEPNGNLGTSTCTGANAKGVDPVQVILVYNPANACANTATCNSPVTTLNIVVGLANGSASPGRIKIVVEDDGAGSQITQFATKSGTLQGHPGAAGAAAVGAAFFATASSCGGTPTLEAFSSAGGDPILFDVTGTVRLVTPVFRQKPDFVGPDGGNDTFLGFKIAPSEDASTVTQCLNNAGFPNFLGTSAAAPHVASIAALLLQAAPSLTPTQIYGLLQQSAVPIGTAPTITSPNFAAGYGFVLANVAANNVPLTDLTVPAAPTLTLAASSIAVGSSTTLTWSSANNQGCTASGSWTGAMAATGTQTVTPAAVGTDTYTMLCTNGIGASPATSVTLSVTAAPPPATSSGGGGGAVGLATLLGLLAMCLERTRRLLRPRSQRRELANIA